MAIVYLRQIQPGTPMPDFSQLWFAARILLDGGDPYAAVGPGRAFDWNAPLFYPLPAVLVATPLAALPLAWAAGIFAGGSAGLLAWALSRTAWWPLLAFLSAPVLVAAQTVQWSVIFAASFALPMLGVLYVAKPTIGAAFFIARPTRNAAVLGILLVLVSVVVQPDWIERWLVGLGEVQTTADGAGAWPYLAPVRMPGGLLILLALLRWRRPEARLLVALACVPQTPALYEAAALLLIPRRRWEMLALVALGWVAVLWMRSGSALDTRFATFAAAATAMMVTMYLPCVGFVLSRPNEGRLPDRLEALLGRARLPGWLSGTPGVAQACEPSA